VRAEIKSPRKVSPGQEAMRDKNKDEYMRLIQSGLTRKVARLHPGFVEKGLVSGGRRPAGVEIGGK